MNSIQEYFISVSGDPESDILLSLSGHISLHNLNSFQEHLRTIVSDTKPQSLTIDLGGVDYLDSAGMLALLDMEQHARGAKIPFTFTGMSSNAQGIMELIDYGAITSRSDSARKNDANMVNQVGEISEVILKDFANAITFLGDLLVSLFYVLAHPRSVRWPDFLAYARRAGLDGLPIVALLSFLLGLIIAFMSSIQLKQFGANIYVASLVGFGMVRELGPIMTAIIFTGRSGSAFSAEIGTMMVNEEVDALVTMGFNPTRFLALPKVLSAMLVVPLLTLYSDLFGILGGMAVAVLGFDLTIYTYIKQTMTSISIFDITSSLVKSVVFAILIAGIGCQRGFRVHGGAESVGIFTTSAVVAGLFLIIVTDSLFAIIFYYIH